MSIPTTIESLSTTAASNGPSGSDQRTLADDGLRQGFAFIKQLKSLATLASASTITPPSTANTFSITGTTTINTIASTNSWDGRDVWFIFAGALTLTHGSNLALPGSANITTAANDAAVFIQTASGAWRCGNYLKADGSISGTAFVPSGSTVPTNGLYLKAANNPALASNSTLRWDVSSAGAHTFAAPTAGDTISVNVLAGSHAATLSGSTTASLLYLQNTSGSDGRTVYEFVNNLTTSQTYTFGIDPSGGTTKAFELRDVTRGATPWSLSKGGNLTLSAPASGVTQTTTAVASGIAESWTDATKTANLSFATNVTFGPTSAHQLDLRANNTSWLSLTTDGRLYGTALHNNSGAVTGTTNQYIASGTYTPAITNGANVAASTAHACTWMRVGNVVTVAGLIGIDVTAADTQTTLHFSLPIASNFVTGDEGAGVAVEGTSGAVATTAALTSNAGNDDINMGNWRSGSTTANTVWSFTFTYAVV